MGGNFIIFAVTFLAVIYISMSRVRLSGITTSITILNIQKFFKEHRNIFPFRFVFTIAKGSIVASGIINMPLLHAHAFLLIE